MTASVRPFRTPALGDTPYIHGVVLPEAGRMVVLAGLSPIDAEGALLHPGDVTGQLERVVELASAALAEAGGELSDVIRARISVATADRGELFAAWTAFARLLAGVDVAATLVGVTVLAYPGQLVEVEFDAFLPPEGG
ncbi:RidA family protein [Microbacterium caowuchunii]|uniref:Rid family hydrolase n=1 Tax=Microbacterium caowuchunii TaxID=2614638 RepID=UPI001243E2E7|nr:Rid family hydrolase [Microbacterium caowuchunii]QEV99595.1 RidA family protein [Microbacterium caowuchunii]